MARRPLSRREFVQAGTGIVAAGAIVPYFWMSAGSQALGADERPGVASIGVGGRGSGVGHDAGSRGNMLACADVDRAHAERFAAKYNGQCRIFTDYRRVLDLPEVELVTIGTPDHWHSKIAIEALQAGKDVYCEKPLTLTIDEGRQICRVVRETKRVFQVGTQQRSDQKFQLAVAIARSGRLGHPLKATCSIGGAPRGGPFATAEPPEGLDWDFWLGQCPVVAYSKERCHGSFRWWLEYSGGKLTDWGAHHVDIAHWGLGKEATGPIEIEGQGDFPNIPENFDPVAFFAGQSKLDNGYNTASQFHIDLKFADGCQIHIQHGPDNGIWLEGEKGRLFVKRGKIAGQPVEELTPADKERLEQDIAQLYKGKPQRGHMQNFFDCVRDRGEPVSDVFSHHRGLSSCHLANIAMLLKRKLRYDPAEEKFPDDDQANALLRRPQREKYRLPV